MKRYFYLIAYDIKDNKRRSKVAKIMESLGCRVQGSVFEAHLSDGELKHLDKRVRKFVKECEDSIRIYQICRQCQNNILIIGQGSLTQMPGVIII